MAQLQCADYSRCHGRHPLCYGCFLAGVSKRGRIAMVKETMCAVGIVDCQTRAWPATICPRPCPERVPENCGAGGTRPGKCRKPLKAATVVSVVITKLIHQEIKATSNSTHLIGIGPVQYPAVERMGRVCQEINIFRAHHHNCVALLTDSSTTNRDTRPIANTRQSRVKNNIFMAAVEQWWMAK